MWKELEREELELVRDQAGVGDLNWRELYASAKVSCLLELLREKIGICDAEMVRAMDTASDVYRRGGERVRQKALWKEYHD